MNTVTISNDYFDALVRENEKIDAVRRLVNSKDAFVCVETILAVLGIEREVNNG